VGNKRWSIRLVVVRFHLHSLEIEMSKYITEDDKCPHWLPGAMLIVGLVLGLLTGTAVR